MTLSKARPSLKHKSRKKTIPPFPFKRMVSSNKCACQSSVCFQFYSTLNNLNVKILMWKSSGKKKTHCSIQLLLVGMWRHDIKKVQHYMLLQDRVQRSPEVTINKLNEHVVLRLNNTQWLISWKKNQLSTLFKNNYIWKKY